LPPGGPEVVLLRRHVDGRRRASSPALPYRSRLVLAFGTLDESSLEFSDGAAPVVRALKSVEMSEVMISQVRCDIVNVPGASA
jgi:hypothetical protein